MTSPQTPNLWIPVCCERVMRYNMFVQKGGAAYGALVCSVCNKNVTFELENNADLKSYGEGSRPITMLAAPKPPNVERKKSQDTLDDQTL